MRPIDRTNLDCRSERGEKDNCKSLVKLKFGYETDQALELSPPRTALADRFIPRGANFVYTHKALVVQTIKHFLQHQRHPCTVEKANL